MRHSGPKNMFSKSVNIYYGKLGSVLITSASSLILVPEMFGLSRYFFIFFFSTVKIQYIFNYLYTFYRTQYWI